MKPPHIPSPEQWKQLYDTCSAVDVDMVRLFRTDPSFSTGDIAQQTRCMANALLVESNATTSPKKQSRAMQGLLAVHRVEGGVFVDYICVAASHRHRGIGTFLLELVPQPAFLIVASLSSAMRFYAKRGYQLCISMPYLPGIGEIGMTRHSSTECDHALPPSIDVTRTVVHSTWNDLSESTQQHAVALVSNTAHVSHKAAKRLLRIDDANMRYSVVRCSDAS